MFGEATTEYLRDWAVSILDDLCGLKGGVEFTEFLRSGRSKDWHNFYWENQASICNMGIELYSGATKGVIADEDCCYVIKLPFLNDRDGEPAFDYCRAEWRNFLKAREQGLEEHFAWIEKVVDYLGYPVYVMEYIEVDEERNSSEAYKYITSKWEETNDEDELEYRENRCFTDEDSMLELAYHEWGSDCRRMEAFLFDNLINDLHAGNVGWRDGELVLCDYSGYGAVERCDEHNWWDVLEGV